MIRSERAEGVTRLILDRPDKRNALDWDMIRALTEGIEGAGNDPACRCVVVKGAGGHFCTGRDLGAGRGRDAELEQVLADDDTYQALFEALRLKRLELARAGGIAPFMVFPDRTLLDMVAQRPRTLASLVDVHGVGEAKRDRWGQDFLTVIRQEIAGEPTGE